MRDMHCHILPGVDDGAVDLAMSLEMLAQGRPRGGRDEHRVHPARARPVL